MHYRSALSQIVDGYRAGAAVAEQLASMAPEVILMFVTTLYQDQLKDVVEGIHDVLGRNVLICGGTGDGVYESAMVSHHGISALGINSEGKVKWSAALEHGTRTDSARAAAAAARRAVAGLGTAPTLAIVFADSVHADGSRVVDGLIQELSVPCIGGLAGDDRHFERSAVFVGDQVTEEGVMVLAAAGDLPYRLYTASGWTPMGDFGTATSVEGPIIHTIDHRPATTFIAEQVGRTMDVKDLGMMTPLAEYVEGVKEFALRTWERTDPTSGAIRLIGRISQGSRVRVCRAALDDIVDGVRTAMVGVSEPGFTPGAVVAISCATRKWLLSECGHEEVRLMHQALGPIPLVGIPSFGEIGPFRSGFGYTPPRFHNVTFVVGVLGL